MKSKLLLFMFLIGSGLILRAQNNISVASFKWLETDLTATMRDTQVKDQNGQICALIKVETTETGFTFDFGMMPPRKVEQHPGEIWMYVPYGVKKVTIQHSQFGVLREWQFPMSIEKGKTYLMQLSTGKVGESPVTQQYLVFQITPPNAVLWVDDELWGVDADGSAMKYVDFGTYSYRVMASDYFTETGNVAVDDPENTKIVPVILKPNFAEITLVVDADAEIWVNNQKKGTRTWTGLLGNGTYKIECKQANHETSMVSKEITPAMNGQTINLPAPTPIYGSLNIESTPNLATIYIDGKEVGKTPRSINELLVGQHEVKLAKDGYADHIETVIVEKGERKQLQAIMRMNKSIQDFNVDGISFKMIYVEGGTFRMGATSQDKEARDDEKPIHSVTLDSYYIGETEVTQALWMAVMGSEPEYLCRNVRWREEEGRGGNYPAYHVSWDFVQEFLRKLNQKTGRNFRLPTEAEWEFAAKGGVKSKGYVYAGSNIFDSIAGKSANTSITLVKSHFPNELGLYDMSGNVIEWCQDWYDNEYYSVSPSENPKGPAKGSERVLRGGDNSMARSCCRVTERYGWPPFFSDVIGFRIVLPTTNQMLNNEDNSGYASEEQTPKDRIPSVPQGALPGKFSVSPLAQVHFSQGNLQYQATTNSWRFADHQWDYVGGIADGEMFGNVYEKGVKCDNGLISSTYSGWIDLFFWGTSGYNHGAVNYLPYSTLSGPKNYYAYGSWSCNLDDRSGQADWGYNAIVNGGNQTELWRTMTSLEWDYLINKRETASGIRYVMARVNDVKGVILLPDDWKTDYYQLNIHGKKPNDNDYRINILNQEQWIIIEQHGAVFLPVAGQREYHNEETMLDFFDYYGTYWTATCNRADNTVYSVDFDGCSMFVNCSYYRNSGYSVRLVCPIE